jgi:hypothetical protein
MQAGDQGANNLIQLLETFWLDALESLAGGHGEGGGDRHTYNTAARIVIVYSAIVVIFVMLQ